MIAEHPDTPVWRSNGAFVFLGFAAVAAGLLAYEHRGHLLGAWPLLLLLACALLHVFMHGGHGHGGRSTNDAGASSSDERETRHD